MNKVLLFLFGFLVFASSCTYYNVEEEYADFVGDCDTSAVSFALDVYPIIDANCVTCHGDVNPQAGLSLTSFNLIKLNSSQMQDRINRPMGDPLVMPQSGPMIQCNIDKINAWINQGALNN